MTSNAGMQEYWNAGAGNAWIRGQAAMDRTLGPLGQLAQAQLRPTGGEQVLDVGCGCGDTTLALARAVGRHGRVTGIDLSHAMLEHGRQRAVGEGLDDRIEWLEHDAQTALLEHATQDAVYSRFGVMFFAAPVAAFANLASATRPGGRLAFVCWRELERNPWLTEPIRVVAPLIAVQPPVPDEPGPFGLASRERTLRLLAEAGWRDPACQPHEERLLLGPTLDAACELLLTIGAVANALRSEPDSAVRERVAVALRSALAPYACEDGIRMPSSVWIVSATR